MPSATKESHFSNLMMTVERDRDLVAMGLAGLGTGLGAWKQGETFRSFDLVDHVLVSENTRNYQDSVRGYVQQAVERAVKPLQEEIDDLRYQIRRLNKELRSHSMIGTHSEPDFWSSPWISGENDPGEPLAKTLLLFASTISQQSSGPRVGRVSKSVNRLRKEKEFFRRRREQLLEDYEGKYVAITGSQVVDSDVDFSALADRVFGRFGVKPIYMPKVSRQDEKIDLTRPRITM